MTDLPEMVERVARAITTARYGSRCAFHAEHKKMAIAAIQAMREPTQAMWDAGARAAEELEPNAWEAMIDAALGEDEDGKTVQN